LAFTADWATIPTDPDYTGEPVLSRQILLLPIPENIWTDSMRTRSPVSSIEDLGGELVNIKTQLDYQFGAEPSYEEEADDMNKGAPVWLDATTLVVQARFSRRDRFIKIDISVPSDATAEVLYYEPDDTLVVGGWIYYHDKPALSPDGRWLAFTRFGCDLEPNEPDAVCTGQSIWVLDMDTTDDARTATAFPLTSECSGMTDPCWSPDGTVVCFAARTDLVGETNGPTAELFRVDFDATEAETGAVTLDRNLQRLTTTNVSDGDPITGLHAYAPTFSSSGNEIYFVSSRRAPASTQRGRNIWRVPADGRLEPELLFFSQFDDVDPVMDWSSGTLILSSKMGFPTEVLNALEQETIDFWYAYNDTSENDLSDVEIYRRAAQDREQLEYFEDVMSHLFLFRGF